jgi:hypothetical protein
MQSSHEVIDKDIEQQIGVPWPTPALKGKASDRSPFTLTCEVDLTARSRRTRHNFPSTPSSNLADSPSQTVSYALRTSRKNA